MTSYLKAHGIRIFDYARFAEPLRDRIRSNAEKLAEENGIEIEFLRRSNVRKEAPRRHAAAGVQESVEGWKPRVGAHA
jgi:hypothetical protein